jgi:hypothetical protein
MQATFATQINNAKGIQLMAAKYAPSQAEEMAKKMMQRKEATGTFIAHHNGGVQSVIGWGKLGTQEKGKANSFTQARTILEKNPDFIELMQDFANLDDPNSENFGATKAGKYAKVVIEFEVLTEDEMDNRVGSALGVAGIEANINGTWINIQNCKFNLIKDVYKQTRIIVLLRDIKKYSPIIADGKNAYKVGNNGRAEKLDTKAINKHYTAEQFAQPIRILTHEIFIHARAAAERLSKFQKMPTQKSFDELLASTEKAIGNDQSNQFGGRVYSKEHQAISGIDENGNAVPYNEEYERVNDKTYEILKNENGKLVRVKQKSPNPGEDNNARMYAFSDLNQENSTTIEEVSKDEAFLHSRLEERTVYTSPINEPIIKAIISKEYIDAKPKK